MAWAIVISLILLAVIYILITPVHLYINSAENQFYIQQRGLGKANLEWDDDEIIRLNTTVFFYRFNVYPLKNSRLLNKGKKDKAPKKTKHKSKRFTFRQGMRLLKTFKVKQLAIDIDTGDYVQNAKMYPLFAFLNYRFGSFNINFEGRNNMAVHIQNRPIKILKSIVKL